MTGLDVDRYTVKVTYLGDKNFDAISNSTEFNVTPIELPVEVIAFNVTVEQNPFFVIGVDSDFKGNVTIAVDGVTYDGDVKLLTYLDKLAAGNKTAIVTFYGDDNYIDKTMEVNFTVSKLDPSDEIKVIDQGNGTVVVVVGDNATGNVTIVVDGKNITAEVINGTAVVNIMINNTVLWTGEFGKDVGENGEDVTYLEYPAFYDLPLVSGDIISFGIQLNGEKADKIYNSQETDEFEENSDIPVIEEEKPVIDNTIKELFFVDGYNSRFEVVYSENASVSVQKLANNLLI